MKTEEIVEKYSKQILRKLHHNENDLLKLKMIEILVVMAIKDVLNESLADTVHLTPKCFGDLDIKSEER
jgi:molybdopterin/thiamine biosynthesis adenylyltransferase